MFEKICIQSSKKEYSVVFLDNCLSSDLKSDIKSHFIVDKNVFNLNKDFFLDLQSSNNLLIIDATEKNKSLNKLTPYVEELVKQGIKRHEKIVAIGGGIIQDISCFLATTILRGIEWEFIPTTLLSQSDSCIGSKSSINVGDFKNILGTFSPPKKIIIDTCFLNTLDKKDIFSGVGEMIKVHAINGKESLSSIIKDYDQIFENKNCMKEYIYNSLLYKKKLIELDEFDTGPRNIMNYGHSFGHAIESATKYKIPHGIAVSMGMDLANFVSREMGLSNGSFFKKMHNTLVKNYNLFSNCEVPLKPFFDSLSKDKKNTSTGLKLILPDNDKLFIDVYKNDSVFKEICSNFFLNTRINGKN